MTIQLINFPSHLTHTLPSISLFQKDKPPISRPLPPFATKIVLTINLKFVLWISFWLEVCMEIHFLQTPSQNLSLKRAQPIFFNQSACNKTDSSHLIGYKYLLLPLAWILLLLALPLTFFKIFLENKLPSKLQTKSYKMPNTSTPQTTE